jgi:hypothetical protein
MAQPGWYPDPSGTPGQRYFDGKEWTEHCAVAPSAAPAWTPPPGPAGKQKLKVWPWIAGGAGVLVLLIILGSVAGGNDQKNEPATSQSRTLRTSAPIAVPTATAPRTTEAPVVVGMGQEARDGKFGFTVTDIGTSQTAGDPSNQFMQTTAQGVYVIVTMTVKNIGNEPQAYFGANQKLIDTAGREYSPDSAAEMWTNKDIQTDINPGNQVVVKSIFDVPPGTTAAKLELHDSAFSGGTTVTLS